MVQSYNLLYAFSIPKYTNILLMEGQSEYKANMILHDWNKFNNTLCISLIDKLIILKSISITNNFINYTNNIVEYIIFDLLNMNRQSIINYFSILYNMNSHLLFLDLLNMLVSNYYFSNMINQEQMIILKENLGLILDTFTTSANSKQINVDDKTTRINLSVRCMDRMERVAKGFTK